MGKSTEELNTDLESSRQQLSRNIDELNDKVNPQRVIRRRKDAAVSRMGSVRDRVMGTASDTRGRASSAAGGTVTGATETASRVAQGAVGTVEDQTQGSPLAAGLVAFGAGMLISALVPASNKEADAAQRAMDAAREHGQPVTEDLKSAGRDIADNLKESATDRVEEVKSSAQESAETVRREGQSSADQIKEQARERM